MRGPFVCPLMGILRHQTNEFIAPFNFDNTIYDLTAHAPNTRSDCPVVVGMNALLWGNK